MYCVDFVSPFLTFGSKVRIWSNWISTLTTAFLNFRIRQLIVVRGDPPGMTQGRFFNSKSQPTPPPHTHFLWSLNTYGGPSRNVRHKMLPVWYYPARGLCSPGYALVFENRSECILPWEWRMPDRGHGFAFREITISDEQSRCRY